MSDEIEKKSGRTSSRQKWDAQQVRDFIAHTRADKAPEKIAHLGKEYFAVKEKLHESNLKLELQELKEGSHFKNFSDDELHQVANLRLEFKAGLLKGEVQRPHEALQGFDRFYSNKENLQELARRVDHRLAEVDPKRQQAAQEKSQDPLSDSL